MTTTQLILLGCAGGLVPDLLRLIKGRHEAAPDYLKSPFFWVMTLVLVGLGGVTAYYSRPEEPLQALTLGFAAPEIISRLVGAGAQDNGLFKSADAPKPSALAQLRAWWAV